MNPEAAILRLHMHKVIHAKVSLSDDLRREAIIEYFSATSPGVSPEVAELVAAKAKPLLPNLYNKWISLFLDRLFETVPFEQIKLLCDSSPENNAALVLAYLMFLESERMEKQIEADLKSAEALAGEDSEALSAYVWSQITALGEKAQQGSREKAEAYRRARDKSRDN